jgi:peroxiredoxin
VAARRNLARLERRAAARNPWPQATVLAENGDPAPDFRLPATGGRTYEFADVAGPKGTVIVFICNHCPYVKAVIDRMVADARTLLGEGFGFAAICSNDAKSYPEDSFANMQRFAKSHRFPFPYLHDEDQAAARAYGAVCTPDFFGYDAGRKPKYRGRSRGRDMRSIVAEMIARNWPGPRGGVIVGRGYTRARRPARYGLRRRRLRSLPAVSRGKSA